MEFVLAAWLLYQSSHAPSPPEPVREAPREPKAEPKHRLGEGRSRRVPEPWRSLAECESSGRWDYRGLHSGGLQFTDRTWKAFRRSEPQHAWQATPRQQVAVAKRVLAAQGWGAWPVCSGKLGLR